MAATALVGFPNPPRTAEAADKAAGVDPVLSGLVSCDALSLAEGSGPYVVALTVLPPRRGPAEFRVNVVGVEADDGLGDAVVFVSGPNAAVAAVPLVGCGAGCFRGLGRISDAGTWSFRVTAASKWAPIDVTLPADLPAPNGTADLRRVIARLEELRSVAMQEELRGSSDGPIVPAKYRFSAPNAFEFAIADRTQIVIGSRTYDREKPGSPWTAKAWSGDPFRRPLGYYRTVWHAAAAARVLGTDQLDGRPMTVIAFARPGQPAWIRRWVGVDGGLVHRELMAGGHLMDRTYTEFDTSTPVVPPPPVSR